MGSSSKIRIIAALEAIALLTVTEICSTEAPVSSSAAGGAVFGVEGYAETRDSGAAVLDITSSAIPNMIETNNRGELVFTDPGAMCAIRTTDTRKLNLEVRLEEVRLSGLNLSNRHYILIRKNGGDIGAIWNAFLFGIFVLTSYQACSLDISGGDYVELFPRISKSPLSIASPSSVTPGMPVTSAGIEVPVDTEVDFGCIYRVKISVTPSNAG